MAETQPECGFTQWFANVGEDTVEKMVIGDDMFMFVDDPRIIKSMSDSFSIGLMSPDHQIPTAGTATGRTDSTKAVKTVKYENDMKMVTDYIKSMGRDPLSYDITSQLTSDISIYSYNHKTAFPPDTLIIDKCHDGKQEGLIVYETREPILMPVSMYYTDHCEQMMMIVNDKPKNCIISYYQPDTSVSPYRMIIFSIINTFMKKIRNYTWRIAIHLGESLAPFDTYNRALALGVPNLILLARYNVNIIINLSAIYNVTDSLDSVLGITSHAEWKADIKGHNVYQELDQSTNQMITYSSTSKLTPHTVHLPSGSKDRITTSMLLYGSIWKCSSIILAGSRTYLSSMCRTIYNCTEVYDKFIVSLVSARLRTIGIPREFVSIVGKYFLRIPKETHI